MTNKQYERYKKLKYESESLKSFLFWYGKKYHGSFWYINSLIFPRN